MAARVEVRPLTRERWGDLVELFGRRGAGIPRSCWCMYYRKTAREPRSSEYNKRTMKSLVNGGTIPGLIAYEDDSPVGWISLGPRENYARLERSPVMRPVDDKPVWSIVCFFVDARARGRGVTRALLRGATAFARSQGATLLEAYPIDKPGENRPDSMWFGARSLFDDAGFREVARRKPERPVMRKPLRSKPAARGR
jgi:GNAT superfamily N-acetyltransferase